MHQPSLLPVCHHHHHTLINVSNSHIYIHIPTHMQTHTGTATPSVSQACWVHRSCGERRPTSCFSTCCGPRLVSSHSIYIEEREVRSYPTTTYHMHTHTHTRTPPKNYSRGCPARETCSVGTRLCRCGFPQGPHRNEERPPQFSLCCLLLLRCCSCCGRFLLPS